MILYLSVVFGIFSVARTETCVGRYQGFLQSRRSCQCNIACSRFGCPDYRAICEERVTDPTCDLSCIATHLWNNDVNRLKVKENLQGRTTSRARTDDARSWLFSNVSQCQICSKATIRTFMDLLDNYEARTTKTETISPTENQEIQNFLDMIMTTKVMNLTYGFLRAKGHATDEASFRNNIKQLWFYLYRRSRNGPINSSGFEHVMVGELKSSSVSGFHNWLQFYLEERNWNLDYKGWISSNEPSIVAARFTWHGKTKSKGSFFVGVSPEFDIAIYTVCALMRPNKTCSFNMNGHSVKIRTWVRRYGNKRAIASAYPEL